MKQPREPYEGFADYETFVASLCDGFTNALNERMPEEEEPLCNMDGGSVLMGAFDKPLTTRALRSVTSQQLKILKHHAAEQGVKLNNAEILDCLRHALRQSVGDDMLDCDRNK